MPRNALFVGHSLVNHTMPHMLNRLLTGSGVRADAQVINGAPLQWQWEHGWGAEGVVARDVLPSGDYNALILTEAVPLAGSLQWSDTYHYARNFAQLAWDAQAGARVMIYDDDHFYMGSVLAELLVARGCTVDFVTPATKVAEWTENTLEQAIIQRKMLEIGVTIHCSKAPEAIGAGAVSLGCTWTGRETTLAAEAVLMVTSRIPNDALYHALMARRDEWGDIQTVRLIGDAAAPGPIAWATYAGRRYAEELDEPDRGDALSFRREIAELA